MPLDTVFFPVFCPNSVTFPLPPPVLKCQPWLIWIEAEQAPPRESWKARRPQRWRRPAHSGRGKKQWPGSSAIISYEPIETTSPANCLGSALRARVCVCAPCVCRREEERREGDSDTDWESEGRGREGAGSTYPPPPQHHHHQRRCRTARKRRGQSRVSCQSNTLVAAGIISATNYWQITCQGV